MLRHVIPSIVDRRDQDLGQNSVFHNGAINFKKVCLPVLMLRDVPDPMTSEGKETCAEPVSTIAGIVPLSKE